MRPARGMAMLGDLAVGRGAPVAVMGALNVSPESFYPGSVHRGVDDLVAAAAAMVAAGAAVVDVGARSTAPYLTGIEVTEAEESSRLEAAVTALVRNVCVPVSADTARLAPARAALEAGARVLNDVSGLADERVGRLAARHGVSVVLMASPQSARAAGVSIEPTDPLRTVLGCLGASLDRAIALGIEGSRVLLDPGIGFFLGGDAVAARCEWDTRVLAGLEALAALGRPVAVGVSRKSFIGTITGHGRPEARLPGSLAATALAVAGGAAVIRTHDVHETVDAVRVAERIASAGRAEVRG